MIVVLPRKFAVVLAALVPAYAHAESTPQPQPRAVCTAAVDGHVVDRTTHEPIAGATVMDGDNMIALTDSDGHFLLTGLCPGALTLRIGREDYAPATQEITVLGRHAFELELDSLAGEVINIRDEAPRVDTRSTTTLRGAALDRTRGRSLAKALAEVPGVAELGSGTSMGKPMVRGQYGRRLALLVDGVRHRAQEWGLDHAPEIDPFTADQITVVRGASGVRFGPDAIGGAVLVDSAPLPTEPGTEGAVHMVGNTRGWGGAFAGRVRHGLAAVSGLGLRLEGSLKTVAAPSTPSYALGNAGAREWNIGGEVGLAGSSSDLRLGYRHYQATLGVCYCLRIDSGTDFLNQLNDQRPIGAELFESEFGIDRPYQSVGHDLVTLRGSQTWDRAGTLRGVAAFQHDLRREFDAVRNTISGPQFNFRLFAGDVDVSFSHRPLHLTDHLHLRGDVGVLGVAQLHAYSGLPLVPDFQSGAIGAYAVERLLGHRFELEAGVRVDALARTARFETRDFARLVRSGQLEADACTDRMADPVSCTSSFLLPSASVGGLLQLTGEWSSKLDLSLASRAPTTDEQYLNGTSPTFPVLGLGKPDAAAEATYSATVTTSYAGQYVSAELSAYANRVSDYLEFAPAIDEMGEPIFDVLIRGTFPRFVTRAVDATFWGADGGIGIRPLPWLELNASGSIVRARKRNGGFLAFVPPDRARGSVTLRRERLGPLGASFATMNVDGVARQRRFDPASDLSAPPRGYVLIGAEAGGEFSAGDHTLQFALTGSNLSNQSYRDYTSLLRYFADQPGWQVALRITVLLNTKKQGQ